MLVDFNLDGRVVKAVAQPTKQAYLYVLDRKTGKPIWPIEEKPVPQGSVPGEWYSPTQPIPSKPPAYGHQGVTVDDLIDFTPELRAEALQLLKDNKYEIGPLFTPPVVSKPEGPLGVVISPAGQGGTNWPGGAYDPETHLLYVFSETTSQVSSLIHPPPEISDMDYVTGRAGQIPSSARPMGAVAAPRPPTAAAPPAGGGGPLTVRGLPLLKPPYGILTAINLDKGDLAWEIAHGETPDNVRNSPALKGLNIPRTGRTGLLGPLVTKTLVIIGEAGFFTAPNGQRGAMLRAYDKATGKEVGAIFMPAPQSGSPMTYMLNGQQYLAVAISGGNYSAELVVYKLPSGNSGSPATQSRAMQPAQPAAAAGGGLQRAALHRGTSRSRPGSVHAAMRLVPWTEPGGHRNRPAPRRSRFHRQVDGPVAGRPVRTHPHHHAQKQTRQPHPRGGRRHHRLHPQREPVPGRLNRFACRHAAVEGNSNRCRKTAVIYTSAAERMDSDGLARSPRQFPEAKTDSRSLAISLIIKAANEGDLPHGERFAK